MNDDIVTIVDKVKELADANARIRKLYQLAFQRAPDADELQLAHRFLESQAEPNEPDRDVWAYGYGRFDADRGRVVERGLTDQVLGDPHHPYTQLLVASQL